MPPSSPPPPRNNPPPPPVPPMTPPASRRDPVMAWTLPRAPGQAARAGPGLEAARHVGEGQTGRAEHLGVLAELAAYHGDLGGGGRQDRAADGGPDRMEQQLTGRGGGPADDDGLRGEQVDGGRRGPARVGGRG